MKDPVKIGIVGGGQLGRMLAIAAKNLGFTVIVTDPTPHSPAGQVADKEITGGFKDEKTIRELANASDVITIEAEFVNTDILRDIQKTKPVHPSPDTIDIIKDKLQQKKFLRLNQIATAQFQQVETVEEVEKVGTTFGYPFLLKARMDAYDGKGNAVIRTSDDIEKGLDKLKDRKLYIEKFIPFVKEIAVMVARNTKDEVAIYPVVETIHKDNICDIVMVPANISQKARKNAEDLAKKVVEKLSGAGVFGIEMFLEKDDNILVNEIAPRVHNSGHYTIESCVTSQFEQHIRAITGLPLGATDLLPKAVVMKNILGEKNGPGTPVGLEKALAIPDVTVHMYGKHENRIGRKMGHITVIGDSVDECLRKAEQARKLIKI